jgi:hypothetical protein
VASPATGVITQRNLTVTAVTDSKTYDATTASSASPTVGSLQGTDAVLTAPTQVYDNKNVGSTHVLTASGLTIKDAGSVDVTSNYNITYVASPATGVITTATLTYIANAANKTYGDANPSFSGTVTGFASGDNLSNATTGTAAWTTSATQFSNVTSYAITGSGLTSNNGNYTFVQAAGNATAFTINQRPLNFTGTRMYDGTVAFTSTQLNAPGNTVNSDVVTLGGSATVSSKNVGTYTGFITNSLTSSNSNYKVTGGVVSVSITAATLTYNANAAGKTYGNANPSFTGTVNGFASGDNLSNATTGTASWTTTATQFSNVASYAITGGGLTANNGNYTFVQAAGNATAFTIDQRSLNFTGTRMYNGTPIFTAAQLNTPGNTVNGDVVTLGGSATVSSPNVGTYTNFVTNSLTSSNSNYKVTGGTVSVIITPQTANPLADAYYTGANFYWTTGPSSKTATLALTATITNNLNYTGDIRTAKVSFFIRNSDNSLTPITGAQNLPVGLVDPSQTGTGTSSVIVQYNIGSVMATSLNIAVKVTGNYVENPTPDNDGMITIAVPVPGGIIAGGGKLCNNNSNGYVKGAASTMADFSFYVQYNKSLTNPQGSVEFHVKSYNDRNGNVTSVLHYYKIKSTSIASLSVGKPTPGDAQFTSKANISEIVNGVESSIEGGCTMQLDIWDGNVVNPAQRDKLGVTLFRKAGGVWYSNNWNGTKTVITDVCGASADQLSVTGSGTTSTVTTTRIAASEPVIEAVTFNLKAYPNPSTSKFTVNIQSSNREEKIQVRVIDLNGRVVELFNNLSANQSLQIGSNYRPGMYIVEMIQGNERKQLKLVKQPN